MKTIAEIAIALIEQRCALVGNPIDAQQGVIIINAIREAVALAEADNLELMRDAIYPHGSLVGFSG
jgi:hypothetical protein